MYRKLPKKSGTNLPLANSKGKTIAANLPCGCAASPFYKGGLDFETDLPPLQREVATPPGVDKRLSYNNRKPTKSAHGRNRVRFAVPIYLFFSCTTRVIISTQPSGVRRPESKDRS